MMKDLQHKVQSSFEHQTQNYVILTKHTQTTTDEMVYISFQLNQTMNNKQNVKTYVSVNNNTNV